MKLKPKDYKNIPDKEKYDIKFDYDYAKSRREIMEDKVTKLKKMTAIQYLEILNDETKKKLIGLCLNKNIMESLDENDDKNEEGQEEAN